MESRVTVHDTTALLAAANGTATTIVLAGGMPFVFTKSIESGTGPTALLIDRDLTLEAEVGSAVLDADGRAGALRRVLTVRSGTLRLVRVNLTGGFSTWWGGGVRVEDGAHLALIDSHVVNNEVRTTGSTATAAGLQISGTLTADHSSITGNVAFSETRQSSGGGLRITSSGIARLTDSVVADNTAATVLNMALGGGIDTWGRLTSIRSSLTNNTASSNNGQASGGGMNIAGGVVMLTESTVAGNTAACPLGFTVGGGVQNLAGKLLAKRTTFAHNTAISDEFQAQGGALQNQGTGEATLIESLVADNSVLSSQSGAHGGGVFNLGKLMIERSSIANNTATSEETQAAGGGLHNNAGVTSLLESTIIGGRATGASEGFGGGLVVGGGTVVLLNSTIAESHAHPGPGGLAIDSIPGGITAALLTVRQTCAGEFANMSLIETFPAGELLLRNLTLDTQGCNQPIATGLSLLGCEQTATPCGPFAVCSDSSSPVSTPLCTCLPNDLRRPYAEWFPSPDAPSEVLAPYLSNGCVEPLVGQLRLNPNFWRLTNATFDVRACLNDWQPPEKTPCIDSGCASGLEGPLCRVCTTEGRYYDHSAAACLDCSSTGVAALIPAVVVLLGVVGSVRIALWQWRRQRQQNGYRSLECIERASLLVPRLGLISKAKIALTYYQVVLVMPQAFDARLPHEYKEWMRVFSWISLDWFHLAAPASCIGDFRFRLTFLALAPLVFLTVFMTTCAVAGAVVSLIASKVKSTPRSTLRHAAWSVVRGDSWILPLVLAVLFALVPPVCAQIFSTFSCEYFGSDSQTRAERGFLFADYAVQCEGDEYNALHSLAIGLVFVWPVGVPVLFCSLLLAGCTKAAWAAELRDAVAFLHIEYRPTHYYWELLELMRKITLTGFVFLIPQRNSDLRLVVAILVSLAHLVLLLLTRVYEQPSTALFAAATSLTLLCTLFAALLVKVSDQSAQLVDLISSEQTSLLRFQNFFGVDSAFTLTLVIVFFNFVVLALGLAVFLYQLRQESRQLTTLRLHTGQLPRLALYEGKRWHLFLSHNWDNQDVVATIKRQLQLLVPGVSVFLEWVPPIRTHPKQSINAVLSSDASGTPPSRRPPLLKAMRSCSSATLAHSVDDLESIDLLEEYVQQSQAMLVLLGSRRYFLSKNCLREVAAAKACGPLPLVRVHEADPTKSGSSLEALEIACPRKHEDFLFPDDEQPPVTWHRLRGFQLVSLAQIAERLLLASPAYKEADRLPLTPSQEGGKLCFKSRVLLYYSASNIGAAAVARKLQTWSSKHGAGEVTILSWGSTRPDNLTTAKPHFLLYLNQQAFVDDSGALEQHVRDVRQSDIPVMLVHENDPSAGACPFDTFLQRTPDDLKEEGLYGSIAVAWHPPPYHEVSMRLAVQDLGAQEQGWYEQLGCGCVRSAGKESQVPRQAHSHWSKLRTAVQLLPSSVSGRSPYDVPTRFIQPRRAQTANATLLEPPDSSQHSVRSESGHTSALAQQECGL